MNACEEVEQFSLIATQVRQEIKTSCGKPEEVRIHDGEVRSEEDHDDNVRATGYPENETHDDYHTGKVETARSLENARSNNHCECSQRGSEGANEGLSHKRHVDMFRDVEGRVETFHE